MAASPPAWFLASVDELVRLGFAELDEYRRDDMWGGWEERWSTGQPADAGTTLSRAISLYPGCVWTCESLAPTPESASFGDWFSGLAAISRGALVIRAVEEAWSRYRVTVRFATRNGWFEFSSKPTHGSALTRELLAAANAAVDG